MKVWMLFAVLLSLVAFQGTPAAAPKTERAYSKVEVRGTIGQGAESQFDRNLNWGGGFGRNRGYFTIKVEDGGEWRLVLDEAGEKILSKNVGKMVTITGTLGHQSIRVKTVNGLVVE